MENVDLEDKTLSVRFDNRMIEYNSTELDNHSGHTSSAGRYVTNSRGDIVINDITGVITVTETATVEGYAIDPANNIQTVHF